MEQPLESKYFFDDWSVDVIREISPEALVKVYKATGYKTSGKTGVKVSTGESENSNYLRPALIKNVALLRNASRVFTL